MLDDAEDGEWVYRRDPTVRRRISLVGSVSGGGIPYVVPEIQLLYKAEQIRPKDEIDFAAVLPVLAPAQREWLARAIHTCHGDSHPWLSRLGS